MARWDVFRADRLEVVRGLDAQAIRQAVARGEFRDDDLVRPAGTTVPWSRLSEMPELIAAPEPAPAGEPGDFEEVRPRIEEIAPPSTGRRPTELPDAMSSSDVAIPVFDEPTPSPATPRPPEAPPAEESQDWGWADDEEDEDDEEDIEELGDLEILDDEEPDEIPVAALPARAEAAPARTAAWEPGENDLDFEDRPDSRSSHVALPVVRSRDRDGVDAAAAEGDADPDASFSLARPATDRVEELDLAPMVDVAFNLVLFFMVTATTVLYKTLEIPRPSGEAPAGAVAQGRSRSMDDLKSDFIVVEIDEQGSMKLDGEPVEPTMTTLVELLRRSREKTGRKAMLLSANFATPHRNAVLAYDAANEIGLSIAIARPQAPLGPAPTLRPGPAAPAKGAGGPAPNAPS